jgi:hypothetical protein
LELLFEEEMKDGVKELFDKFEQDTRNELWIKRDELVHNIQNPGIVDSYISGETGYNLLFVHKAIGMGRLVQELKNFAGVTLEKLLAETNKDTEDNLDFLHDALNYNACCISNLFQNIDKTPTSKMKYDIEKFISEDDPVSIAKYLFEKISEIKFVLQDTQKDIITRSLDLYGSNVQEDCKTIVEKELTKSDFKIYGWRQVPINTKVFVKKILRTGFNPSKSENQTRKIIDSADWPYC